MRAIWLSILSGLVIAGCSSPNSSPGSTGPAGESTGNASGNPQSDFKVALLTPGPVSDAGWSAMALEGLKSIEMDLGAQTNYQQEVADPQKIRDAMRSYAQQGYKLIFGHGYEYNEPAIEIGKAFPETVFISSSGSQTAPNVGAFRFKLEEGFYLAGMAAGLMTKSNALAMIGGDKVASIQSTFKAFQAGAKAANPKVVVKEVFTGNGQDVAKARQATLAAIGEGADFVIHQANAAAKGVFDACKEKRVYAFGANLDQNGDDSGVVIASAVIVGKAAFLKVAGDVKAGTFKGDQVFMGMADEAIDFIWNPALMDTVPGPVVAKIIEARDAIKAGTLKVPMDSF